MSPFLPRLRRARPGLLLALALAAACDTQPLAPKLVPEPKPTAPAATPVRVAEITCVASRAEMTLDCDPPPASSGNRSAAIIVGGQNQYVRLASSSSSYAGTTLSFNVTLRNLVPQTLGTSDGTTLDANGIRVFFHEMPSVTGGTGTVTINNADGVSLFTAASQPYFQYNQMLPEFGLSSAKSWSFDMPATVTAFTFKVYVSAPVQWPEGYVLLQSGNDVLRADATRLVVPTSKSAMGNDMPAASYTWTTSDTTIGTIDLTGTIQGKRNGPLKVTAKDDKNRIGTMDFTVTPIARLWTAGVATTDFADNGNWSLTIRPTTQDTVIVNVGRPAYPVLTQNESFARLELYSSPFARGPYSLTLSTNLNMTGTASLPATSGALTVQGNVTMDGSSAISSTTGSMTVLGNITMIGTSAISSSSGDVTVWGDMLANESSTLTSTSGRLFLAGTGKTISQGNLGTSLTRLRVTGTYSLGTYISAVAPLQVDAGRITSNSQRLQVDSK